MSRECLQTGNPGLFLNNDGIDPRLQRVKASMWTSVVIDDGLFAKIITSFIAWDHLPLRLFDEDLFLNDMAAGCSDFCSKLLVNAALALGCVCLEKLFSALSTDKCILVQLWCIRSCRSEHCALFSCRSKTAMAL